ncbi:RNA polymerase sigma factor [Pirellulaceae bacterium SH449]
MHETSLSLIDRLQNSPENEGWSQLEKLYAPLLHVWLRRYDVQDCDAQDLVQEVLLSVSKELGSFDHPGIPGSFRGWLKVILLNRLRKFWRSRDRRPQVHGDSDINTRLAQLDDPTSELSHIWNREHDQYVLRQLLALVEPHFEPNTWRAFCRVALDGATVDVVSTELGISKNAIIVAKCRVLNRLRREAESLVETSSHFLRKS